MNPRAHLTVGLAAAALSVALAGVAGAAVLPTPATYVTHHLPTATQMARLHWAGMTAAGYNLRPYHTNCDGGATTYSPPQGEPMTRADFVALGQPVPPAGSPLRTPGVHWVVAHCSPIPGGSQPGGPDLGG